MQVQQAETVLDKAVNRIVAQAASDIAQAVRLSIAEEVARVCGGDVKPNGTLRKRAAIVCAVPQCGRPGGGPKWGWFGSDHKDLSPKEKSKARAATRRRGSATA